MQDAHDTAQVAAGNNADLCAAIMTAHGLRFERDASAFLCLDAPPPYYPNMITLDPAIPLAYQRKAMEVASVKDSFSSLDGAALGLQLLFEASWIWSEPKAHTMPAGWHRISTTAELSAWHSAWRGDGAASTPVIFPPACLNNPDLAFLARASGTRIQAGCIANLSEDAVGLSNVFSGAPDDGRLYPEALAAASTVGQGRPVAGYECGEDLDAARVAGFRDIGHLRVWIRPPA
ncbi:hypothetical protein [uncultured Roseobacter sp.]|uniref:hypothetical protein n=1 Tax=uncultured Roseobacter sp. TaxID=114847 RepID=UPI00260E00F2|nr:hypothetical protein [uncultured Roseobacter sp.]